MALNSFFIGEIVSDHNGVITRMHFTELSDPAETWYVAAFEGGESDSASNFVSPFSLPTAVIHPSEWILYTRHS